MSISRKCPQCHTWNEESDHCVNCGMVLNYDILQKAEQEERKKAFAKVKVDWMDRFLNDLKHSRNWFARLFYYLLNSVWFVLMAILSFIIAFIAFIAG